MRGDRGRRGVNALEFALLFPVFWLLLAGMCDLGWLFFHQAMLDTATTAGCRAGSLVDPGWDESNVAAVQQRAQDVMEEWLDQTPGTNCHSSEGENPCNLTVQLFGDPPGRSMLCSVDRRFDPLLGIAISTTSLRSAIVVRMEWQRWPLVPTSI